MFTHLGERLSQTRSVFKKIEDLFRSGRPREDILDDLAETLILADVGVSTTEKILKSLRRRTMKEVSASELEQFLKEELTTLLTHDQTSAITDVIPAVFLIVGINGGGKTTTLAKLAYRAQRQGKKVMMAAADTFRAAAQEQLTLWGRKLNLPVIKGQYGADPASVVFDALQSFKANRGDLLLVDTAGRIHTNTNLMNELEKIRRVISREIPEAPHETLLVLDASIGQNALVQAKEFLKFSGLTGIILAKLDGTAKGGSVISIADELRLPIKFIGVGESEEDLLEFSPQEFAEALLS